MTPFLSQSFLTCAPPRSLGLYSVVSLVYERGGGHMPHVRPLATKKRGEKRMKQWTAIFWLVPPPPENPGSATEHPPFYKAVMIISKYRNRLYNILFVSIVSFFQCRVLVGAPRGSTSQYQPNAENPGALWQCNSNPQVTLCEPVTLEDPRGTSKSMFIPHNPAIVHLQPSNAWRGGPPWY